jgi:hypothetical protein
MILITCILSVEMFSVFNQDRWWWDGKVVSHLWRGVLAKKPNICPSAQDTGQSPAPLRGEN